MRRRNFMTVLAGAAAYPLLAGAQQKALPVVGFLNSTPPGPFAPQVAAFHQGLSETGYVEGQNLTIEYRWAEGRIPAIVSFLNPQPALSLSARTALHVKGFRTPARY